MSKRIPSTFPCVKLSSNARPSISDLRTQSSKERVTTAEAVALLFEDMAIASAEVQKLWDWIRKRISANAAQSGRREDGKYTLGKREKQEKLIKKAEEQRQKIFAKNAQTLFS